MGRDLYIVIKWYLISKNHLIEACKKDLQRICKGKKWGKLVANVSEKKLCKITIQKYATRSCIYQHGNVIQKSNTYFLEWPLMETLRWFWKRKRVSKIPGRAFTIGEESRKKRHRDLNAKFAKPFLTSQRNFNRNNMAINVLDNEWKSLLGRA